MVAFPAVAPAEVVFLSGAGISADGPTNGPIGVQLTERALDYAFAPGTSDEIRRAYAAVGVDRAYPRLEAVLEIAVRAHGTQVLGELLSDLASAPPNELHDFFREHLSLGGRHITANFTLIEGANATASGIVHFHGRLGSDPGLLDALGARLSRIEGGFDERTRRAFDEAILGDGVSTLVVVGYSGLDFFDVDPYVAHSAARFAAAGLRVVWVHHDFTCAPGQLLTDHDVNDWPPMLQTLNTAGVHCERVRGRTVDALNALAAPWSTATIVLQPRGANRWAPPRTLGANARAEATRKLYLHMGMYRSHDEIVDRHPDIRANVSDADAAEIDWQRGRIGSARRHWRRQFVGDGDETRARRHERDAACLWVRGSYLRAYVVAARAERYARLGADDESLALCLEMRARVLVHIARLPDLWWFPTQTQSARLSTDIRSFADASSLTTHICIRLRDAAALLRSDPESTRRAPVDDGGASSSDMAAAVEAFNQYESLSAVLDFRRGEIRRRGVSGVDEIDVYRRGAEVLGKNAALASLPVLPGAEPGFGMREGLRLIWGVDATPYHRMRLTAGYLRGRSRRRAKGR